MGRIAASATPCACIKRQQHGVRAVWFARHHLPRPAAAGRGDLVQYANGRCPALARSRREWITKDKTTGGAEAGDGESQRDELLICASQSRAWPFRPSRVTI